MKSEIKRIIDKFLMCVTVIAAVTIILCGKTLASERGDEMLNGTQYKSVMLEASANAITVSVDEKEHSFDKELINRLLALRRYASFSPVSSVTCFLRNFRSLIESREAVMNSTAFALTVTFPSAC